MKRQAQRGSTLLESVLFLPIMFMLLFGMVEVARITWTYFTLQKILYALESQPPYLSIESMTLRPLNAFRGFKPAPGQEPEINVQLDVAGYAFAEPERK